MKSELHLIVLWEKARAAEEKILADLKTKLEIVDTGVLSWPGDAEECFGEFYGANLPEAKGKVVECGAGAFRYIVVRDNNPTYAYEDTSRGLERVNLNLFALKNLYRSWTGGGHKVHTTNSPEEFHRDIKMLKLPGHGGWSSLRELFAFLDSMMPYVVLRNAESLPDDFDPALHGDIDLLVPDAVQCAAILGAKKVFPEPYRVHYEVMVAGAPVRFDFRYVGDDYYCRAWEDHMLDNRRMVNGVNLLSPEDAFYALVYHALYQKKEIAADYPSKAAKLAKEAGVEGASFDDWLIKLEEFLKKHDYEIAPCDDTSVMFNVDNVRWRKIASEIASLGPFDEIRPYRLDAVRAFNVLQTRFFRGRFDGKDCFIKYSPVIGNFAREEWRIAKELTDKGFEFAAKPLFWHKLRGGGSIVVTEFVEGESLASIKLDESKADEIAAQIGEAAAFLRASGFVHRDIRPQNLLIDSEGKLKLIDFQFAVMAGGEELIYREPELAHDYLPMRILAVLGEGYALARGKWNDDYSFLKCLEQFPPTEEVRRVRSELMRSAYSPRQCGLGSPETMARLEKRMKKLRKRRLLAKFGIKRRRFKRLYAQELEMLESI